MNTNTLGHDGLGSNSNERLFYLPKNYRTGVSLSVQCIFRTLIGLGGECLALLQRCGLSIPQPQETGWIHFCLLNLLRMWSVKKI